MEPYVLKAYKARGFVHGFYPAILCEVCGKCWSHDVDHIRGRIGKLLNDWRYLIFVCRECHHRKGGYAIKCDWTYKVRTIITDGIEDESIRSKIYLMRDDPGKLPTPP